jgi:hypothetical protein
MTHLHLTDLNDTDLHRGVASESATGTNSGHTGLSTFPGQVAATVSAFQRRLAMLGISRLRSAAFRATLPLPTASRLAG